MSFVESIPTYLQWFHISLTAKIFVSTFVFGVQAVLLLLSIYQIMIAVAGMARFPVQKPLRSRRQLSPRFLCITAAHNEESVIEEHIKNLLKMDYPRELYDVVVIADNCSDDTAILARRCGALVWERYNHSKRGKGYALKWAIHEKAELPEYDALCIFDADNLVDVNFLTVMAKHLRQGHEAIQAYLDTKNPWDSWISAAYASAYWYMNRFWQRARVRLGMSGALGGTGFCLSTQLLQSNPWEAMSLTEDLEYTVRLVLNGEKVFWTPHTRVYDEKPISMKATFPQRTRWLQGHWCTAFKYSTQLLQLTRNVRNPRSALRALDCLLYLWQPLIILFTGLSLFISILQCVVGDGWYFHWLAQLVPFWTWDGLVIVSLFLPLVAFGFEDVEWKAFWLFPSFLLFNLTWIPIALKGLLRHKDTTWSHTIHSRSLTLTDVLQRETS